METSYEPKQDMSPCVKFVQGISIQRLESREAWSQLASCKIHGEKTHSSFYSFICSIGLQVGTYIYYNSLGIMRFIAGLALHCSDKHDFTANHNSEIGGITVFIQQPSNKKFLEQGQIFGDFLNHALWDIALLEYS